MAVVLVAIVGHLAPARLRQRAAARTGLIVGALSPLGVVAGALLANAVSERALELSFAAVQLYFAYSLARRARAFPRGALPASVPPVEILARGVRGPRRARAHRPAGRARPLLSRQAAGGAQAGRGGRARRCSCSTSRSSSSSTPPGCAASSPPTSARASEGRRVVIVRGPDPVQRVFSITRLEERLEMVDDASAVG